MKKLIYIYFLIAASFCCLEAGDKAKMLQDLDVIKSTFETKYAPFEWKKAHFGWSLEEQINFAKIQILTFDSLTVKDYQRILHAFFISTCDYHVSAQFFSTELALLPFKVRKLNEKYLISESLHDTFKAMQKVGLYKGKEFPQIGNELITFDSHPVGNVIDDLKHNEVGNPTSRTTQILTEQVLTRRLGMAGHIVPSERIKISFRNSSDEIIDATIEWLYRPEKIKNHSYFSMMTPLAPVDHKEEIFDIYGINHSSTMMINCFAEMLQADYFHHFDYLKDLKDVDVDNAEDEITDFNLNLEQTPPHPINRNSIVFGKRLWSETNKSDFNVHIYELPETGKRIGYIRISTYSHQVDINGYTQLALRLADSIKHLQGHTDALLVDQVDNPGGLGLYALAIASMLTDRPLTLPKDHFSITQAEVWRAHMYLEDLKETLEMNKNLPLSKTSNNYIAGYPIDANFIEGQLKFNQFIIDQWNSGKAFSDPFTLMGIESLKPHPRASYSKPILVLVNGNDFSCGDFFPAILQDNKRAVIFGEQTAGAGGAIEMLSYPNSFGLRAFSFTVSLAERIDGKTIENLGVTPDVLYEETEEDLMQGYQGYINAVNATLSSMLN
ncbi:MAG: protease-like activity factor CPAF [Parachlamydiaceae bacterium]|nr:protease-like activity factor CPAF [Parachlamydiaceae bacterium]